jgi:hypothetical protein
VVFDAPTRMNNPVDEWIGAHFFVGVLSTHRRLVTLEKSHRGRVAHVDELLLNTFVHVATCGDTLVRWLRDRAGKMRQRRQEIDYCQSKVID